MALLFSLPNTVDSQSLGDQVQGVLDHWSPFKIHYQWVFKSWDHWLLLGVKEGNEKVKRLHQEIYSGILKPYQRKDLTFEPHIGPGLFAAESSDPFSPTQTGLKED